MTLGTNGLPASLAVFPWPLCSLAATAVAVGLLTCPAMASSLPDTTISPLEIPTPQPRTVINIAPRASWIETATATGLLAGFIAFVGYTEMNRPANETRRERGRP